jgi:tRNA (guanine-N7-)-methyltransferase
VSSGAPEVAYYCLNDFRYPDTIDRLYPSNPLGAWHLEVGFGDGRFWTMHHAAEANPNYLGVEISGVSVLKARSRLREANIQNAILSRLAAEFVVRNVVPPRALSRVYVNFPDPWPKARHEDARLLQTRFFEMLSTRLVPDGELWLTTDHPGYFGFGLENAATTGLYDVSQPEPPTAALETKYALKWRDMSLPIHHARFRKRAESAHTFPPLEVHTMPHAVLRGSLPQTNLEKTVVHGKQYTVILLERYLSDSRIVVLARVEEEKLTQEVLIVALHRDDGEVVVGLEPFGSPLITTGVKAAVGAVVDWLAAQSLEVVRRVY